MKALFFLKHAYIVHLHRYRKSRLIHTVHSTPITAPSQIQNGIESIMERPLIMTSSQLLLGNSQLYLAIHVCSDGIFCPL